MERLAIMGGAPVRSRPFPAWPVWDEEEIRAAEQVIRSGRWGSTAGDRVNELEKRFAAYQEAAWGIASTSGTTALRTALLACGIEYGAEVVVPAYTFVASATAALEANAVPVFCDIDPHTYNLDPRSLEAAITPRTQAIMPVHLAGLPADMDRIGQIAARHGLAVVEDACQAWGSSHRGRKVGAIGKVGAFSFQSSKHITAGEGGMLVTDDSGTARVCRSLVNCGRTESGAWHEHHLLGGNYRLTELQAAVILVQLGRYDRMLERRQEAARYLRRELSKIEGLSPLAVPDYVTATSCHLFILRYDKQAFGGLPKARFIEALNAEGIRPAHGGYYIPVNRQPLLLEKNVGPFDAIRRHVYRGRLIDYAGFDCPVAERACTDEAVWLLQNLLLADKPDLDDIVTAFARIARHFDQLLE